MEGTDFALKQIGTGITSFACVLTDELDPFREMLLAGNSLYAPDDDKNADDEHASEDEDDDEEEVDADSDDANDAFLTELVSLHTTPVPLVAPDVLTSGVLCWRFPAEISQGLYNARNGSNACGVIRMMLGYTHWKHKIPSLMECTNRLPAKDIDFTSAKKLQENLDKKIGSLDECAQDQSSTSSASNTRVAQVRVSTPVAADEMAKVYEKLNQCETKAVALSLIDPYAQQFISKSRNVAVPCDLYETNNLEYPNLLRKCLDVQLNISNEDIQLMEKDTRSQAKATSFFRHRAGGIGASVCGAVYHTNLAQPSQSLIQSICYPHLFKLNTKAIKHGIKYEDYAIKAYEQCMRSTHVNFKLERCGMFINKDYQFIHATPDFLVSCDCCGLGIGEVKCPISIPNGDFGKYLLKKNCCLEKVNGDTRG